MSDLWELSDAAGVADDGSEEWECSESDSAGAAPPSKRRRTSEKPRKVCASAAGDVASPSDGGEDEDEAGLAAYLSVKQAAAAGAEQQQQQQQQQDTGPSTVDRAPQRDAARAAVLRQQELRARLALAQHAGEAGDSDDDEQQQQQPQGEAAAGVAPPEVDLTAGDCDEDGDDDAALQLLQEEPPSTSAAAAAGEPLAGAGGDGKLGLQFNTQGGDVVTLRVVPGASLGPALSAYAALAASKGWGAASRFVFDDCNLSPTDCPADLGMEEGDVVDVYLA